MKITDYHAKYFAHELTKRSSSDKFEKIASTLIDAQVDLNPHQIDAALFAFKSPLSKGAIMADEVGLGKTIEAGIVISQKWAERKRKILIIVPSSLRKQWSEELQEKFFLPSTILEAKSFNQNIKNGNLNPFVSENIIIASFHFIRNKAPYVKAIKWDLVVIDEAHRLRNVYKSNNKIARTIKESIQNSPKILLTATPLQNSLLELYGLVSIIDDHIFGDINSFKNQFSRMGETDFRFPDLKKRLAPICIRTLRRQVLEYIRYTNRIAITQEFTPQEDEQLLYEKITDYLQTENLYALPPSQRKLMTLILRRLLASSSFAIAATLDKLMQRLEGIVTEAQANSEQLDLSEEYETFTELSEEFIDEEEAELEEENNEKNKKVYSPGEIAGIKEEIEDLQELATLAKSIITNSKGERLMQALDTGFKTTKEKGGKEKAIIFTESTKTQKYILDILSTSENYKDKVVLFNGSNNDEKSKEIYQNWLQKYDGTDKITGSKTADKRAALVDYFREEAVIMIATEAAAEGINLQFCSLVINYDLPWNPQRIEQRIGRCHRYGQKHDVVVVNFLNIKNEADIRVYQILKEKFKLFDGVFGASDEVLGIIESGVDFEKRIAEIYQKCRTQNEIKETFEQLQLDLETEIDETIRSSRKKLIENFDEEVQEKLKIRLAQSKDYLSRYEEWLWSLTKHFLQNFATFEKEELSFYLSSNPFPNEMISNGPYRIGKNIDDAHIYRVGHPLAERIMKAVKDISLDDKELIFDLSNSNKKITILEQLLGKSGWLTIDLFTISTLESEDHVVPNGLLDDGTPLDEEQCKRLFSLSATAEGKSILPDNIRSLLHANFEQKKSAILQKVIEQNAKLFDQEIDKLDDWAYDKRNSLKIELDTMYTRIKELKKEARLAPNLPGKLEIQKKVREHENKHKELSKKYFEESDKIDAEKDLLLDDLEKHLGQHLSEERLFTIHWSVV